MARAWDDVAMFLCLFQSCSQCNAWQPDAPPGHDETCRSGPFRMYSGLPNCFTVSTGKSVRDQSGLFHAVSARLVDDYQQMSWCLGLHAWLTMCVCVCLCWFTCLGLGAEFWLWTLLKRRQASLILNMDHRRNTIRSQCFLNWISSELDGRMLLT